MKISKNILPNFDKKFLNLIKKLQTPCVCYDKNFIVNTVNNFKNDFFFFKEVDLFFAVKANNNRKILKILLENNVGVDVASYEEYKLVKELGFKKISVTSHFLKKEELEKISTDVIINIDNIDQIQYVKGSKIGIRINIPNTDYDIFGVKITEELLNFINKHNKKVVRLHFHTNNFTIDKLMERIYLAEEIMNNFPDVTEINFGGDLLTLYNSRKKFLKILVALNENPLFKDKKIIFEPGDALVKYAGFLVTQVIGTKEINEKNVLILDSSTWVSSPWGIENPLVIGEVEKKILKEYYVVGNTMYPGDVFGKYRLQKKSRGDILLFPGFGSYKISNFRNFHKHQDYVEYLIEDNIIEKIGGYCGSDKSRKFE